MVEIRRDGKTNCFSGDEIESLEMEQGMLADFWTLTLKDGQVFRIKPDWRGIDVYVSMFEYKSTKEEK